MDSETPNATSSERGNEIQEYVATDTESIAYEIGDKAAGHLDKFRRKLVVVGWLIANETGI